MDWAGGIGNIEKPRGGCRLGLTTGVIAAELSSPVAMEMVGSRESGEHPFAADKQGCSYQKGQPGWDGSQGPGPAGDGAWEVADRT